MLTTLNQIRSKSPCREGWTKLLTYLNKTAADDEPLSIITVLDSNGLDDALWCLQAVKGHDREIRLYAVWCARQVQHLMQDPRSLTSLDVAERYAKGLADEYELSVARDEIVFAERVEAWDAAWAVAANATRAAAWSAARWCAANATRAATRAAVGTATRDAAWSAARAAQETRLRKLCFECDSVTLTALTSSKEPS